jgi:hypothetical protein
LNKLCALLKGKSKLFQTYFYTGVNCSNQKEKQFLSNICSIGYKIISKEIIRQPDGVKANLDVELASMRRAFYACSTRYKIQDKKIFYTNPK